MKALTLTLALAATAAAQSIDYNTQISNKPVIPTVVSVVSTDFNWSATLGSTATGNLSSAGAATITLKTCPKGLTGADTKHYLRISGGTGDAEVVLLTGGTCTPGQKNGTVQFATSSTHTGAVVIGSATAGLQEAVNSAASVQITIPVGNHNVYANTYAASQNVTIEGVGNGCGSGSTVILASDGLVGFHINTPAAISFSNFCIMSALSAPTSGSGIKIDSPVPYANTISKIDHMQFYHLYIGIDAVNVTNCVISHNFFLDQRQYGIKLQATNNTDVGGCDVSGNGFLQTSQVGTAAIYHTSSGAVSLTNNKVNGYSYAYWVNAALATGTSELTVANNVFEGTYAGALRFEGTASFPDISITGNRLANYTQPNWIGIDVRDATVSHGTITGNVISGQQVSGNVGIEIVNASDYIITGNQLDLLDGGIQVWSGASNIVIGPNVMKSVNLPFVNLGTTGTTLSLPFSLTYSTIAGTSAANGSIVYCSNCAVGASCSGSGTGAFAKRLNGAWVCN